MSSKGILILSEHVYLHEALWTGAGTVAKASLSTASFMDFLLYKYAVLEGKPDNHNGSIYLQQFWKHSTDQGSGNGSYNSH